MHPLSLFRLLFRSRSNAPDDFARSLSERDETWVPLAGRSPRKMPHHGERE
jgi:hypothetical protein